MQSFDLVLRDCKIGKPKTFEVLGFPIFFFYTKINLSK